MSDTTPPTAPTVHVPILVGPIVKGLTEALLKLPPDAPPHWIVDFTLGGGGHTDAFLKALASDPRLVAHKVLAIDQDAGAIERARHRFAAEIEAGRLELQHCRFSESEPFLRDKKVAGILADLGFSSDQLESAERGLSFLSDGPLDMRLDPSRGRSCREYLSQVTERELEEVLRELGEERFSRRIAAALVQRRREKALPATTKELADLVVRALPASARHGRIHAATRTFQALRIEINGEMNELDWLLKSGILFLVPGGRIAILSFHSLEDRKVKVAFRGKSGIDRYGTPPELIALTKKPIEPDLEEVRANPRARSAKLRIAERAG